MTQKFKLKTEMTEISKRLPNKKLFETFEEYTEYCNVAYQKMSINLMTIMLYDKDAGEYRIYSLTFVEKSPDLIPALTVKR